MYYFEYPSYVTMLLREIKYGIELTLGQVTVDPFMVAREKRTRRFAMFEYHVGNVDVSYDPDRVVIAVPSSGDVLRSFKVTGLYENKHYTVLVQSTAGTSGEDSAHTMDDRTNEYMSSNDGTLTFTVTDIGAIAGADAARLHVTIDGRSRD